jgi:hypothetical protein
MDVVYQKRFIYQNVAAARLDSKYAAAANRQAPSTMYGGTGGEAPCIANLAMDRIAPGCARPGPKRTTGLLYCQLICPNDELP